MGGAAIKMPEPGETIAGKYRIERVIGEGGMGRVFEASHVRLAKRLAVKILPPNAAQEAEAVARFEREARIAAQLKGINITRVIDVDVLENGLPYIVLELLVGRDLEAILADVGALSIQDGVDYVAQAALAMSEAHQAGIVHRDLKPSNLFLCDIPDSERKLVKVLDFGISMFIADEGARMTKAHSTFGTAYYMSPEQVRSARDVDGRSDIWSLGVILYEVLTGKPPFEGAVTAVSAAITADPVPRPRDRRPKIPVELEEVVLKALAKDRNDRFQTAAELRAALEPFGSPTPIEDVMASRVRSGAVTPAAAFAPVDLQARAHHRIVPTGDRRASPDAPTAAPWSSSPPPKLEQESHRPSRRRALSLGGLLGAALVVAGLVVFREKATRSAGEVASPASTAGSSDVAPVAAPTALPSLVAAPAPSPSVSASPGATARRPPPTTPSMRPPMVAPSAPPAPAPTPAPIAPRNPTHI